MADHVGGFRPLQQLATRQRVALGGRGSLSPSSIFSPSCCRRHPYFRRRHDYDNNKKKKRRIALLVSALKTAVGTGDTGDNNENSGNDPGRVGATPPSAGRPKQPRISFSPPSTEAKAKPETSPAPSSSAPSLLQSFLTSLYSHILSVVNSLTRWITGSVGPWIAARVTGPWILALACIFVPLFRDQLSLQLPLLWLGVQHWPRLLFSCFLHTDAIALLVSLLWLATIARPVQAVLGTGRVIAVAAVSAVVGNLAVFFATYSYSVFQDSTFMTFHPIMEPLWTLATQMAIWMEKMLGEQVSDLLISNSTASSIAFANDAGDIGLGCCLVGLVVAVRAFRRQHTEAHAVLAAPLSLYSFPLSLLSVIFLIVIWDASPPEILRKLSAALAAEIFVAASGPKLVPRNCPSLPLSAVPLTRPDITTGAVSVTPIASTPRTLNEIKEEYGLVDRPNGIVAFERIALMVRVVLRRLRRRQRERDKNKATTSLA